MSEAVINSPWLDIEQASAYVHRGRRFLRGEVKQGRLRAAKIGGRGELLMRREWLDAWVEQQSTPVIVGRLR